MPREQHRWQPTCPPPTGLVRPVRARPRDPDGPSRGAAGGPDWRSTSHGFYVPSWVDASVPEQRILEQSVRLPAGGAVTGWAGCRLWGAGFFDGLEPDGRTPVPVPLAVGRRHVRGDGSVAVWRDRIDPTEVVTRHGVPCASELRSLFDAVRRAGDRREAVVDIDMMAAAELVSIRRLDGYRATRAGWLGAPQVDWALRLACEHSRSPNETRMRLIWVLDASLPTPLVNRPVFDLAGRLLGIADLLDVEAGVVGEFDGADHRLARRHSADLAREDRLRRHGLELFRISGPDLADVDRVVARMLATRRRALWEPPGARRWTVAAPPSWEDPLSLDEILDRNDLMREIHLAEQEAQAEERVRWSRSASRHAGGACGS